MERKRTTCRESLRSYLITHTKDDFPRSCASQKTFLDSNVQQQIGLNHFLGNGYIMYTTRNEWRRGHAMVTLTCSQLMCMLSKWSFTFNHTSNQNPFVSSSLTHRHSFIHYTYTCVQIKVTPVRTYKMYTDTYWIAWLGRYGTVAVFTDFIQVLDPVAVWIVRAAVTSHLFCNLEVQVIIQKLLCGHQNLFFFLIIFLMAKILQWKYFLLGVHK